MALDPIEIPMEGLKARNRFNFDAKRYGSNKTGENAVFEELDKAVIRSEVEKSVSVIEKAINWVRGLFK